MIYPPSDLILALNGHPGIFKMQLRGRNAAITTSAEAVWAVSSTYTKLTSGTALEVVSDSANDTSAGTGARTVVVCGLDGSYLPFRETVTLNGVTPVALSNSSAVAVNRFYVASAGSTGTNAGSIDVRTVSGATIKSRITGGTVLGYGRAADFLFTVPANYTAILKDVYVSGTGVTGDLSVWIETSDVNGVLTSEGAAKSSQYTSGFNGAICGISFGAGLIVPQKTLIQLKALVSAGAGDIVAMADLYLVQTGTAQAHWGTGAAPGSL